MELQKIKKNTIILQHCKTSRCCKFKFVFVCFVLHIRVKHKTLNFLAHNLPLVETGRREEAVVIVRLSDRKRFNTGATRFFPRSTFHSYITVKSFFFFPSFLSAGEGLDPGRLALTLYSLPSSAAGSGWARSGPGAPG